MKKRKRCVKIFALLMAVGLLLLSGCGRSFADLSGNEKLHIGIQGSGLPETMREGIENGADIDQLPLWMGTYDSYGMKYDRNPLRILIAKQNTPYIVEIMLQAGADPNTYDGEGYPLLFRTAAWGAPERMSELLLEYGADPSLKSKEGESLLHCYISSFEPAAANIPKIEVIRKFLDAGAKVDEETVEQAMDSGVYHVLEILYQNDHAYGNSFSELQLAYLEGDIRKGNLLLEQCDSLTDADQYIAAIYGNRETVSILSKKHTDFFRESEKQAAIITLTAWGENTEAVSAMLQDEQAKRLDADQIKAAAYATDNAKLLAQLYENEWIGDPDEDDLVKIAGANAENILRYLSDRGYDFEKNTEASTDALIEANYMGYSHIFRLLLEYGALPSKEVLLDICTVPDDPENLELLIKYGADLKQNGKEAMENAIESCSLESIKTLHSHGVEITKQMYQNAVKNDLPSEHVLKYLKENAV